MIKIAFTVFPITLFWGILFILFLTKNYLRDYILNLKSILLQKKIILPLILINFGL